MKRLALGIVAMVGVAVGTACLSAVGSQYPMVHVASEEVAIIYDARTQTEHFIRKAKFDSEAPDFAFVAPTPSRPELGEADSALFTLLRKFVPPPPRNEGGGLDRRAGGGREPAVQVIETKDVAGMRATILKARKAADLQKWLRANGYATPVGFTDWVRPYLVGDWHLTAFKFIKKGESADVSTKSIRLSFKTDRPYYPYRIPKGENPFGRDLRIYVVAPFPVDAKTGNMPRTRQLFHAGALPDETYLRLLALGQIDPDLAGPRAVLTIFSDSGDERAGADDLWFTASSSSASRSLP